MIHIFNTLVAIGIIIFQIVSIGILYAIITQKKVSFISKNYLTIGFLITLGAVIVSMIYSSVIGYAPCLLCWWARIFMFPQLIIFGIALIKKDFSIYVYSGALSLAGIIVSGYHTFVEQGGTDVLNCAATGPSCLSRYVYEFGYITIPVMALSGSILLLLLSIYQYKSIK